MARFGSLAQASPSFVRLARAFAALTFALAALRSAAGFTGIVASLGTHMLAALAVFVLGSLAVLAHYHGLATRSA